MPDEQDIILVDLSPAPGVRGVAAFSVDDLHDRSTKAIENTMDTIQGMSTKVVTTMKKVKAAERPSKVEVEFGIKLTAEGDALVAKIGGEAFVNVTLTWEQTPKKA
jgi:Trypsin-co-occurring domain 1